LIGFGDFCCTPGKWKMLKSNWVKLWLVGALAFIPLAATALHLGEKHLRAYNMAARLNDLETLEKANSGKAKSADQRSAGESQLGTPSSNGDAADPNHWEIPGLQAALTSGQPGLQKAALWHLARFGQPLTNPPPQLLEQVRSLKTQLPDFFTGPDFLIGLGAIANVSQLERADEAKLLQHIQNKQPNVSDRETALALLLRTANPVRHKALVRQLASNPREHVYVRTQAAEMLGQLGDDTLPDLLKIFRDRRENPQVRGAAALGLSQLTTAKPYLREIGDFFRGNGKGTDAQDLETLDYQSGRVLAARGLSRWGALTQSYLPDLYNFIKSDQQSVTYYHEGMADVFADYGTVAHSYLPQLISVINSPEPTMTTGRVVKILGKWGAAARPALPRLAAMAQNCTGSATLAIAQIQPDYPQALPTAIDCLKKLRPNPSKGAAYARDDIHLALEVWAKHHGGFDYATLSNALDLAPASQDSYSKNPLFLAYRLSGGRPEVLAALRSIR
jgi:hypothetical protein